MGDTNSNEATQLFRASSLSPEPASFHERANVIHGESLRMQKCLPCEEIEYRFLNVTDADREAAEARMVFKVFGLQIARWVNEAARETTTPGRPDWRRFCKQ